MPLLWAQLLCILIPLIHSHPSRENLRNYPEGLTHRSESTELDESESSALHPDGFSSLPEVEELTGLRRKRSNKQVVRVARDALVIKDPLWQHQWYLQRPEGSKTRWPSHQVGAAWQLATGKGVTIAIISDGIRANHKDLTNLDRKLSRNFNEGSRREHSRVQTSLQGTKLAGVIAASANNVCGIGVAFDSKIIDLQVGNFNVPSTVISRALATNIYETDIYVNSWHYSVNKTGQLWSIPDEVRDTFDGALKRGRGGRGAIYVWDTRNTHHNNSCAYDPYVNNIQTIAVTGVSGQGRRLSTGTSCSAIMATAYGREQAGGDNIVTTTGQSDSGCTSKFSGSSPAAGLTAGIIALALEVNPSLTWRDVQHLIVQSANPNLPWSPDDFVTNGGAFRVSNSFGFGLLDAAKMTSLAKLWKNVPQKITCHRASLKRKESAASFPDIITDYSLYVSPGKCGIQYLEHVEVTARLSHVNGRGNIRLTLTSPSGTTRVIASGRPGDVTNLMFNWTVMSVHYWGEESSGTWQLSIDESRFSRFSVTSGVTLFYWSLTFHGLRKTIPIPTSIPQLQSHIHSGAASDWDHDTGGSLQWWVYIIIVVTFVGTITMLVCIAVRIRQSRLADAADAADSDKPIVVSGAECDIAHLDENTLRPISQTTAT